MNRRTKQDPQKDHPPQPPPPSPLGSCTGRICCSSVDYTRAVEKADRLISELLATLPLEQTLVAIVVDHGGTEKGHGHPTMRELVVPWILVGPGAARGRELSGPSIR